MRWWRWLTWLIVGLVFLFGLLTLNYNGPFFDEAIYITAGQRTLEGFGYSDGYITWFAGSLLWPALAGLLVGPLVGLVMFIGSWFVIGIGEGVIGPALGLPFLWALASAAGALLYANRKGLLVGLRFEVVDRRPRGPLPPPPTDE